MTALSIRHMNYAMDAMEAIQEKAVKSMPTPANAEPSYYWHIYRKSKSHKGKWIFVRDFSGTKADMAELWLKWFSDGAHKLRCVMKYTKGN